MVSSEPPPPVPPSQEPPPPLEKPIDILETPAVPPIPPTIIASTSEPPPAEEPIAPKDIPEVPTSEAPSAIAEAPQDFATSADPVSEENPTLAHAEDRELPDAGMQEDAAVEDSFYLKGLNEGQKLALIKLKAKIEAAIQDNTFLDPPKPVKTKKEEAKAEEQKEKEEEGEKTEGTTEDDGQAVIIEPLVESSTEVPADTTSEVPPATANEETTTTDATSVPESTRELAFENTTEEQGTPDDSGVEVPPPADEDPSLEDLALWGIPLLHSKADERTDVLLLKFLRARDFKAEKALSMLQDTLLWRKDFNADALVEEETSTDFEGSFIHGVDREGHPVMYNGELSSKKSVEDEAQLKRRIQVLEKGIQTLDFSPNGVHSMVQVIDFAGHSPAFLGRGIRFKILDLLQNNYPELVSKQIFINVPWYVPPLLSLFNSRTRSKAVVAKPGRVAETLFKYISPDQVPVQYGGLSRPHDTEFADIEAPATKVVVKAGAKESIELPVPNAGRLIWDISVIGWDVLYDEEFVPDEGYIKIIRKASRIAPKEEPLRNTFHADAPGKMILTIDNTSSRRRRVIVYRYAANAS